MQHKNHVRDSVAEAMCFYCRIPGIGSRLRPKGIWHPLACVSLLLTVLCIISCQDEDGDDTQNITPQSQQCEPEWVRVYDSLSVLGGSIGQAICGLSDGGYAVAGTVPYRMFLGRLNSAGDTLWTRQYGDDPNYVQDFSGWMEPTTDGGYVLTSAVGVMKVDDAGGVVWQREQFVGRYVQQTTDGGFIVVGGRHIGSMDRFYAAKVNGNGDSLWSMTYTGFSGIAHCVRELPGGGFILAGLFMDSEAIAMKVDSGGNPMWERHFYGGMRGLPRVCAEADGSISLVCDQYLSPDRRMIYFAKLDELGNLVWSRTFSSYEWQWASDFVRLSNGYAIVGYAQNRNEQSRILLVRFDDSGNVLWNRTYLDGWSEGNAITATVDGGFAIAGSRVINGGDVMTVIKTLPEQ